ncbi:MAG TPA: GWxTD domain-containing protein [Bacteroidales bacterium]|nr:GWxTD domain-containing protein [Bacteroidales bacterium]
MKIKGCLLTVFLLAATIYGCYSPSTMSTTNISANYQDESRKLDVTLCAYNINSDSTRIYYQFNTEGLFFQKDMKKNYFYASYMINYRLYNANDIKKVIDSASFVFTDTLNYAKNTEITDSLALLMKEPDNYIISFTITDINKKFSTTHYLNIYKNNIYNRNNFIIRDKNNCPVIEKYLSSKQSFRIFLREKEVYKLFVRYYRVSNEAAAPPFTVINTKPLSFKADSVFVLDLTDGHSASLYLKKNGIYHFQTDTSKKDGFTLFRFAEEFPQISSAREMLGPLRYITTKKEFNDLIMMKNTKSAIDNFWLDKAGNTDRAKELIRIFYNRVQDANRFFSSYTEGWRTDRGMIYIIFGQPNSVYRSPYLETWYYGEDRNILSMTLDFNKTLNPFTENDYSLERSPEYKDVWYSAVESWRK